MNSLFMIIFLLSMLGGIACIVMFILGMVKKDFRVRPKKAGLFFLVALVVFFVSAYGYNATMSDEQKAQIEAQRQEQEAENAAKEAEKEAQKQAELTTEAPSDAKVNNVSPEAEKTATDDSDKAQTTSEQVEKEQTEAVQKESEPVQEESRKEAVKEYDTLQNLFISLTFDTTIEELDAMIQEKGLCSSAQEFNSDDGTIDYVIAYTEGVAKHKYADSGDYIKVSFEKKGDNGFRYASYSNSSHYNGLALLYHHGTWYDFRQSNADDYSGYYFTTGSGGKKTGLVVKYTNGREVQTGYYKCNTAQEAIDEVLK